MKVVEPKEAIHKSGKISGDLIITIPVKKLWGRIIWFSLCFVIITIFTVNLLGLFGNLLFISTGQNVSGVDNSYPLTIMVMLLIPLAIFSITELLVIYALLWRLFGIEIVKIDKETIAITRKIFGWERTKKYLLSSVTEIRIARATDNWISTFSGFQKMLGLTGTISFDYGAKTYLFGNELDQAEARQIIAKLENWFSENEIEQPNPA